MSNFDLQKEFKRKNIQGSLSVTNTDRLKLFMCDSAIFHIFDVK